MPMSYLDKLTDFIENDMGSTTDNISENKTYAKTLSLEEKQLRKEARLAAKRNLRDDTNLELSIKKAYNAVGGAWNTVNDYIPFVDDKTLDISPVKAVVGGQKRVMGNKIFEDADTTMEESIQHRQALIDEYNNAEDDPYADHKVYQLRLLDGYNEDGTPIYTYKTGVAQTSAAKRYEAQWIENGYEILSEKGFDRAEDWENEWHGNKANLADRTYGQGYNSAGESIKDNAQLMEGYTEIYNTQHFNIGETPEEIAANQAASDKLAKNYKYHDRSIWGRTKNTVAAATSTVAGSLYGMADVAYELTGNDLATHEEIDKWANDLTGYDTYFSEKASHDIKKALKNYQNGGSTWDFLKNATLGGLGAAPEAAAQSLAYVGMLFMPGKALQGVTKVGKAVKGMNAAEKAVVMKNADTLSKLDKAVYTTAGQAGFIGMSASDTSRDMDVYKKETGHDMSVGRTLGSFGINMAINNLDGFIDKKIITKEGIGSESVLKLLQSASDGKKVQLAKELTAKGFGVAADTLLKEMPTEIAQSGMEAVSQQYGTKDKVTGEDKTIGSILTDQKTIEDATVSAFMTPGSVGMMKAYGKAVEKAGDLANPKGKDLGEAKYEDDGETPINDAARVESGAKTQVEFDNAIKDNNLALAQAHLDVLEEDNEGIEDSRTKLKAEHKAKKLRKQLDELQEKFEDALESGDSDTVAEHFRGSEPKSVLTVALRNMNDKGTDQAKKDKLIEAAKANGVSEEEVASIVKSEDEINKVVEDFKSKTENSKEEVNYDVLHGPYGAVSYARKIIDAGDDTAKVDKYIGKFNRLLANQTEKVKKITAGVPQVQTDLEKIGASLAEDYDTTPEHIAWQMGVITKVVDMRSTPKGLATPNITITKEDQARYLANKTMPYVSDKVGATGKASRNEGKWEFREDDTARLGIKKYFGDKVDVGTTRIEDVMNMAKEEEQAIATLMEVAVGGNTDTKVNTEETASTTADTDIPSDQQQAPEESTPTDTVEGTPETKVEEVPAKDLMEVDGKTYKVTRNEDGSIHLNEYNPTETKVEETKPLDTEVAEDGQMSVKVEPSESVEKPKRTKAPKKEEIGTQSTIDFDNTPEEAPTQETKAPEKSEDKPRAVDHETIRSTLDRSQATSTGTGFTEQVITDPEGRKTNKNLNDESKSNVSIDKGSKDITTREIVNVGKLMDDPEFDDKGGTVAKENLVNKGLTDIENGNINTEAAKFANTYMDRVEEAIKVEPAVADALGYEVNEAGEVTKTETVDYSSMKEDNKPSKETTKTKEYTVTPLNHVPNAEKVKAPAKARMSNKYIGFGNRSTGSYREELKKQGMPVNSGEYTKDDTVFVSVNGNPTTANLEATKQEVVKVLEAGGKLVTDSKEYLSTSSYNKGEQALATHLTTLGYERTTTKENKNIAVWTKPETVSVTTTTNLDEAVDNSNNRSYVSEEQAAFNTTWDMSMYSDKGVIQDGPMTDEDAAFMQQDLESSDTIQETHTNSVPDDINIDALQEDIITEETAHEKSIDMTNSDMSTADGAYVKTKEFVTGKFTQITDNEKLKKMYDNNKTRIDGYVKKFGDTDGRFAYLQEKLNQEFTKRKTALAKGEVDLVKESAKAEKQVKITKDIIAKRKIKIKKLAALNTLLGRAMTKVGTFIANGAKARLIAKKDILIKDQVAIEDAIQSLNRALERGGVADLDKLTRFDEATKKLQQWFKAVGDKVQDLLAEGHKDLKSKKAEIAKVKARIAALSDAVDRLEDRQEKLETNKKNLEKKQKVSKQKVKDLTKKIAHMNYNVGVVLNNTITAKDSSRHPSKILEGVKDSVSTLGSKAVKLIDPQVEAMAKNAAELLHNVLGDLVPAGVDHRTKNAIIRNKVLDNAALGLLYNQEGKIDLNVAAAVHLAMDEYFSVMGPNLERMTRQEIATLLGISPEAVTPAHEAEYGPLGKQRKYIAAQLGGMILSNLGLKLHGSKSSQIHGPHMKAALGQLGLLMMEQKGYIRPLATSTYKGTKGMGEALLQFVQLHDDFRKYDSAAVVDTEQTPIVEADAYNDSVNDDSMYGDTMDDSWMYSQDYIDDMAAYDTMYEKSAFKKAKDSVKALREKIDVDEELSKFPSDTPKKPRIVKIRNNGVNTVPKVNNEAINKLEERKNRLNISTISSTFGGKGDKYRTAKIGRVKKALGWKSIKAMEKARRVSKETLEAQRSVNMEIDRDVDALVEYYDLVQSGDMTGDVYVDYFFSKNGRIMLEGLINPQNSKLHRFLVIDSSQVREVKKDSVMFRFALAQAFGHSIDKASDNSVMGFAEAILKVPHKELESAVHKLMTNPKGHVEVGGVEIEIEFLSQMLVGLDMVKAYQEAKGDTFENRLLLEVDAKTSGFALKTRLFPFHDHEAMMKWSLKTGVSYGNEAHNMMGTNEMFGQKTMTDSYQEMVKGMARTVEDLIEIVKEAEENVNDELKGTTIKASEYLAKLQRAGEKYTPIMVDEHGKATSEGRNLAKYPFMTKNYGSGYGSTGRLVGEVMSKDTVDDFIADVQSGKTTPLVELILELTGQTDAKVLADEMIDNGSVAIQAKLKTLDGDMTEMSLNNALIKIYTDTYGLDMNNQIEKVMEHFDQINTDINTSYKVMYRLFDKLYNAKIADLLTNMKLSQKERAEAYNEAKNKWKLSGNKGEVSPAMVAEFEANAKEAKVTKQDSDKITKELIKVFPVIKGPLSEDIFDGIGIFTDGNVSASDTAKVTTQVVGQDTKTTSVQAVRKMIKEASNSGAVVPIHYLDGAIMAMLMKDHRFTNVFDALVLDPETAVELVKEYNRLFLELTANWDMYTEVAEALTRSIEAAEKIQPGILEEITKENAKLGKNEVLANNVNKLTRVEFVGGKARVVSLNFAKFKNEVAENAKANKVLRDKYHNIPTTSGHMVLNKDSQYTTKQTDTANNPTKYSKDDVARMGASLDTQGNNDIIIPKGTVNNTSSNLKGCS